MQERKRGNTGQLSSHEDEDIESASLWERSEVTDGGALTAPHI